MQHRDMITIQKVISEMQIGIDMLGTTVHEEYPVLMQQLQNILKKETE